MIEYLRGKPLELPKTIAAKTPPTEDEGTVTSNITDGELLLVDESGKGFRLVWSTSGESVSQPRALPAGEYQLRNYRIERDHKGTSWHISATALAIQKLEVLSGENLEVTIDPRIMISSTVSASMGGMRIAGDHGAGLSIYREEKRIPVEYELVDNHGATRAKGAMNYG